MLYSGLKEAFFCDGKDDCGTRIELEGGTKSKFVVPVSNGSAGCDLAKTSVCLLVFGVADICTL